MSALHYFKHYTYDDYKLWEGSWELYEGYPVAMSPAPVINHQALISDILFALKSSIGDCKNCLVLPETDYKLTDDTVFRPDVALICDELHEAYITKTPEIIFEVISPSTAQNDEYYKFQRYEAEKVKYYVIVYPKELYAKVYQLKNGKYDKQGDFSTQSYQFSETRCKAKIDFEKIFNHYC